MAQATPFDNILLQCRDLFGERLTAALAGMLDKADEALVALANETRDSAAQTLYRKAMDLVAAQREIIETQFRARFLHEFQVRSNRAKKIGADFDDIDPSSFELALVGDDDLNESLEFNAMTARLRKYCEEELIALDQRMGVLLGDAGLQSEDNPLTPQAISEAYRLTCTQVESDVEVRRVMLELFDQFVLDDVRGIYRAANALLVQNSILPKLRGVSGVRKTKDAPAAEAKDAAPDLFSMLQNLVAKNTAAAATTNQSAAASTGKSGQPVAAAASAAPQNPQAGDLLRSLTRVQHGDVAGVTGSAVPLASAVTKPGTTNVLRELKATNIGSSMSQMDAMTLDIVSLLFDQLFDDPKIPIGVKGLIGRLQIPMLKVAIADKAFFSKKTHPARQMLDTLGEVAARLPADVNAANPTFLRMDEMLQALMVGFEDNIEIFDTVREQLETLISDEDQRTEAQTEAAELQIEQQETLALAKAVAQAEIKLRTRGSQLPESVTEFLFRQWIKVLILIQVKEGENSDVWKKALETMDLMIWSVERKSSREARNELVGKVPHLLKRLTEALTYAGIEDAVRLQLYADLRKLHSEAIANIAESDAVAVPLDSTTTAETEAIGPDTAPPLAPIVAEQATDAESSTTESTLEFSPQSDEPMADPGGIEPRPQAEEKTPVAKAPIPESGLTFSLEPEEVKPAPTVADTTSSQDEPSPELTLPSLPEDLASIPEPTALAQSASDKAATSPELTLNFELPEIELPKVEPPKVASPKVELPKTDSPKIETNEIDLRKMDLPKFDLPKIEPRPADSTGRARPAPGFERVQPTKPANRPQAKVPEQPAARPQSVAPNKPAAAGQYAQPQKAPPIRNAPPVRAESLDMTAPVTVSNPFGEGQIEVNDLDFTTGPSKSDTKASSLIPGNLTMGAWVEIQKEAKGEPLVAKLNFISPLKTRFLFVNRHGKTVLECSQTELLRLVQAGKLKVTREPTEQPLFDRLANGVASKLGQRR